MQKYEGGGNVTDNVGYGIVSKIKHPRDYAILLVKKVTVSVRKPLIERDVISDIITPWNQNLKWENCSADVT